MVRVQGQTRYNDNATKTLRVEQLVSRHGQRTKRRGKVFKKYRWRDASVVVYWGRNHSQPLCLVSSHPPKWRLVLVYRRRYPIEAMFRDYKSHGWQWESGQVTDLDHLNRLLVGMALATWVVVYAGVEVAVICVRDPPGRDERFPGWGNEVYSDSG